METSAKTDSNTFLLMKYALPVLLFAGSGALIRAGNPSAITMESRAAMQVPFVLWGLFLITSAEVRLGDSQLAYRRFIKWHRVAYEEIRMVGRALHPGMGWIALGSYSIPWGRLYFVTARPAFDRGIDLVKQIEESRSPSGSHQLRTHAEIRSKKVHRRVSTLRLSVIMMLVGVAYSIFLTIWFPEFFIPANFSGFPEPLPFVMKLLIAAVSWPWALVTCALLVLWVLVRRFRNRSWIFVLIIGALLGHVIIEAIR